MALADAAYACLPAAAMGRLASLRCRDQVEIALHECQLWVRWQPGDEVVAGLLFAIAGCRLFVKRERHWYSWGRAVPDFDVPEGLRFRPLGQVIFPATIDPVSSNAFVFEPMPLTVVPDSVQRPTLALCCSLGAFLAWADAMPACVLVRYRAAIRGDRLFVLGKKLPWIDGAERFWGRAVLVPVGYRPNPNLSETALRTVAGIAESDLLVLRQNDCEVIAQDHFAPVNHAALRLAQREVPQ